MRRSSPPVNEVVQNLESASQIHHRYSDFNVALCGVPFLSIELIKKKRLMHENPS